MGAGMVGAEVWRRPNGASPSAPRSMCLAPPGAAAGGCPDGLPIGGMGLQKKRFAFKKVIHRESRKWTHV